MKDNSNEIRKLVKQAKKIRDRIGKERDKLRDVVNELEQICDDADDAFTCFNDGLDTLSQYL